jgi:hypothetical protein
VIIRFEEYFPKFWLPQWVVFVVETIKSLVHTLVCLYIKDIQTDLTYLDSSLVEEVNQFKLGSIWLFVYVCFTFLLEFILHECK